MSSSSGGGFIAVVVVRDDLVRVDELPRRHSATVDGSKHRRRVPGATHPVTLR